MKDSRNFFIAVVMMFVTSFGFFWVAQAAPSVLTVPSGGTGWANFVTGTVIYGNGAGKLATTTVGTGGFVLGLLNGIPAWTATTTFNSPLVYSAGAVSCATCQTSPAAWPWNMLTTYSTTTDATTTPAWFVMGLYASSTSQLTFASTTQLSAVSLCLTGDVCRTTWPTGSGGGSGNVSTSTGETQGFLAYWTSTNATPALLGKVATTSLGATSPITFSGTLGAQVGGAAGSFACATCNTSNATVSSIATTFPIQGGTITTTGTITFGGLSTTTPWNQGELVFVSGSNKNQVASVGTSTLSASSPLTGSFTQVGSGGSLGCQTASGSQAGCLSSADWTTFNSKLIYSNLWNSAVTYGTTTRATTTPAWFQTAFYASSTIGVPDVIDNYTSTNGTTTNATTTTLAITSLLDRVLSTNHTGAVVATTSIGVNYLTGVLPVTNGGTGAATLTGLLQGNGTGAVTVITDSTTVGQVLRVTGSNTYAWGALNLGTAAAITGTLPIANGGTNSTAYNSHMLLSYNGTSIVATSTPTMGSFYATSTIGNATSTILAVLDVGTSSPTIAGVPSILLVDNRTFAWGTLRMVTSTNVSNAFTIVNNASTTVFNIDDTPTAGASFGIGTSSAPSLAFMAKLTIGNYSGDTIPNMLFIASSTATATTTIFQITNAGHIIASSTNPVVTCTAGTLTSFVGDDGHGEAVCGSGSTAILVTFQVPWSNAPVCVVSNQTLSLTSALTYTISTTVLTISQAVGLAGDKVDFMCQGVKGPV